MFPRRSLPITLAVVMIVLLVVLIVGWVLLAVFGLLSDPDSGPLYVTLLSVGTTIIVLLLLGVVWYLTWSIRAVNLSRRQSNFIDSVTHELKSPIASLKLYLQTLSRRQMSPEQQTGFYQSMLEDCNRLDRLINQVLDAGRIERPPVNGDLEDVDLAALLRECAETICLRYRMAPECVRLDLSPCSFVGRRVDLDMLFRNLIDNAAKYAGNDPRIEISLKQQDNARIIAKIADNGRGIPLKMRRKIFGRFERLGQELTRETPGTGLGLHIVRTVVRRMKGRVLVHDRPGGPGAVFEVQLPLRHQPGQRESGRGK